MNGITLHSENEPPASLKPLALSMCIGGVRDNHLAPWETTLEQIARDFQKLPRLGEKDGSYYVRGPVKPDSPVRKDANIEHADVIVIDADKSVDPATGETTTGAPDPICTHSILRELGIAHVLYSTHSHQREDAGNRYRIIIPGRTTDKHELEASLSYLFHFLHAHNCWLVNVPENSRLSQPFYFPRVADEAAFYLCYSYTEGHTFDVASAVKWYDDKRKPETPRLPAPRDERVFDHDSPIARFNQKYGNPEWLLQTLDAHGYERAPTSSTNDETGYRLLSPNSQTGNPGVSVFLTTEGHWRVKSFHGSHDPLSRDGEEITICSAWDVFRILEHGGDQKAAMTAWRKLHTKSTDDAKQASPVSFEDIEMAPALDALSFPNTQKTGNGGIRLPATVANVRHLLTEYGITVRYDIISKRVEILIPGLKGCPENADNSSLNHLMSLATLNGIANGQVPAYVQTIADQNQYNPFRAYIDRCAWDGQDRINAMLATLTLKDDYPSALALTLLTRWLISGVAAACKTQGFRSRGVLVLQGPQSIGKTAWISALIDDPTLRTNLIKVDHHMDAGDKDSRITAVSHLIVEIGELESSLRKDVSRLKGFLTNTVDKVRRPYDRRDSEYPRRTVFCASVNSENFLVDDTGNTRWWTLPVTAVNYEHGIDMQQLWAQLHALYEQDEQWWLTPKEEKQLEELNAGHRAVSAIRDMVESTLDPSLPPVRWEMATASDVLRHMEIKNPSNTQSKECGAVLREKFGAPTRSRGKTRWKVPLAKDKN